VLPGANFGKAQVNVTAGATCLTSANAYIIGILFQGTATNSARIWAGVTATGAGALIAKIVANGTTGSATVNAATYYPLPAYCSGGITIENLGAQDPSITLFWNPAGGA
jgi:hypothetical protein